MRVSLMFSVNTALMPSRLICRMMAATCLAPTKFCMDTRSPPICLATLPKMLKLVTTGRGAAVAAVEGKRGQGAAGKVAVFGLLKR